MVPLPPTPPTPALLEEYCQARIIDSLPESLLMKDTVVDIKKNGSGVDVHLASGACISGARALIVACSNCKPVLPPWARSLIVGDKISSSESSILTADDVPSDVLVTTPPTERKKAEHVAIIGGGMTAAQLALQYVSKGWASKVTLICRRPLSKQLYDTDVGWWGNKNLNAFWNVDSPEDRLKICRQAKKQGSTISPFLWEELLGAQESGKVDVVQSYQVDACTKKGAQWNLLLKPTHNKYEGLAPFSYTFPDVHGARALATTSPTNPEVNVDTIVLACGSAYNIANIPMFSSILPLTRCVSGYPVIDFEYCVWPSVPVFLIGRSALLAIGPCSGELAGIKLGADKIVAALKRLEYAGTPVWDVAAATLAPTKALPSPSTATAASVGLTTRNKCDTNTTSPSDGLVRPPPLTVLENYHHLEEEGVMWYERRLVPSVSHPPHRIDISHIPPTLPRHELSSFLFSQEDFEICITLALPEPIPLSSVRSLSTERSLEVWAVGELGAYHVHLPRLYGRVLSDRTKVKVNQGKKKVFILLHKEKNAEWGYLKGI